MADNVLVSAGARLVIDTGYLVVGSATTNSNGQRMLTSGVIHTLGWQAESFVPTGTTSGVIRFTVEKNSSDVASIDRPVALSGGVPEGWSVTEGAVSGISAPGISFTTNDYIGFRVDVTQGDLGGNVRAVIMSIMADVS